MSRVDWSREAVLALIEVYKRNPCLWDSKHINYKHKEKNKEAVSEMTEAVKVYLPEVTDEDCRTKYQNLRGQFSKEYAKLLSAKEESGASDLPKAKFWCFYKLLFLKDSIRQKVMRLNVRNKHSTSDKNNDEDSDKNCSYKIEYSENDDVEEIHFEEVEFLDHNYAGCEEVEVETTKKRKLEEIVSTIEQKVQMKKNKLSIPSHLEIQSTDLDINMKQNDANLKKVNKNVKIGELLTETLNECRDKEKRKWAQKEVLNIIANLIDVDSDSFE